MNAADNPFATGRVERLLGFDPDLIGSSWSELDRRWSELDHRACVTGHHGSGKTSFLEAMAGRLIRRGQVECLFFNDRKRCLSSGDRRTLDQAEGLFLMIDGDEYLPWLERRELIHRSLRARGSLFARHRRRGLPELLHLQASPILANKLLARISPAWQRKLGSDLDRRLAELEGNLRELWLECYDLAGNTET